MLHYVRNDQDDRMNPIILFDNILTEGTLTATSTASGYDVDNIMDYRGYTKWKADDTADQYLTWAMGATAPIRAQTGWYIKLQNNALLSQVTGGVDRADTVGIFNHNLGTIGATVLVQYYSAGWNTLATLTPSDDDPILSSFASNISGDWRIKISGMDAAPEVGVIFLGVGLTIPDSPDAPVIPMREGIKAASEVSQSGNLLGTVVAYNPKSIEHRWTNAPNITRTWFTTYWEPFWDNHAKLLYPFFYAWDLTNRPDDIFYGRMETNSEKAERLTLLTYSDELILNMKAA